MTSISMRRLDGPLRPMWAVADVMGRSRETLRDWYRNGVLQHVACDVTTRTLLVDMFEAGAVAEQRPARQTRRETASA